MQKRKSVSEHVGRAPQAPSPVDRAPQAPSLFLRKKFTPPVLPATYIPQNDLADRVLSIDTWRVCFVNASAGYGKTALLSDWYARFSAVENVTALWMSIDAYDANPTRFVSALAKMFALAEPAFAALLEENAAPDDGGNVDNLIAWFLNLVDTGLDAQRSYVIFLDGYDEAEGPQFDNILLSLHRYADTRFHLVVAGNHISARLDYLLLDPLVIEYKNKDICLDEARREELAQALMPGLDESDYQFMYDRCGAWPMAYVFTYLARRRAENGLFERELVDYAHRFFAKEVMDKVDGETYAFLIETAFFDKLIPDLCDYVTQANHTQAILEAMREHNLFVRYDAEAKAYRYQKVFHHYLRDRFLSLSPSYINKLYRRARTWYEAHGMQLESVKMTVLAADSDFIECTIKESLGLDRAPGYATFTEFLFERSPEAFSSDLYLKWCVVWSYIGTGLVSAARVWLAHMGEPSSENERQALAYANALCQALEGDSAGSLASIRALLKERDALPQGFQHLLVHMEGENLERLGDIRAGNNLYLKAVSMAQGQGGSFYRLFDYYLLAHQALSMGHFDSALEYVDEATPLCERLSPLWGEFHAIRSLVQVERGELKDARRNARLARSGVSADCNIDMYLHAEIAMAQVFYVSGEPIRALETLNTAYVTTQNLSIPRGMDAELHAYRLLYAIESEDVKAVDEVSGLVDTYLESSDILRAIPCMLAKSRALSMQGETDQASALLAQCSTLCEENGSFYYLALCYVYEARLLLDRNCESAAMAKLSKAVDLALRNGEYRSIFRQGGPKVRDLLFSLVASRKVSRILHDFITSVLLLMEDETDIDNAIALRKNEVQGLYSLTQREREIVRLLNSGLSRSEIAVSLSVSENTVKTHLKNVYRKMGVTKRAELFKMTRSLSAGESEQ